MKKSTSSILISLSLSMLSFGAQSAPVGCDAKKIEIQQQIDFAKAHGNSNRLLGLEKAMNEITSNCTDASLRSKREAKVTERKNELAQRESELASAKETGNAKKIESKMQKLQKAKVALDAAESALNQ